MENRSFDHFLGWLPGADGRQAGLTYHDARRRRRTRRTTSRPTSRVAATPIRTTPTTAARVEFNGGACDGWLLAPGNDALRDRLLPRHRPRVLRRGGARTGPCATATSPRSSGRRYPNRIYLHAAQTDRIAQHGARDRDAADDLGPARRRRARRAATTTRDVPFMRSGATSTRRSASPFADFFADCATREAARRLATSTRASSTTDDRDRRNDDHPHADIRAGAVLPRTRSTSAVTTSPAWERTLLVITYDEWGGFFDHVPPRGRARRRPGARASAASASRASLISPLAAAGTSRTASTTTRRSSS